MPISLSCGNCDWKGKVKDEMAGKTGKCPTCGEHIPIASGSLKAAVPPPMPAKKPLRPVDDPDIVEDEPKRKSKFSLDDAEDDRPRKRRSVYDDDDDEERPKKKKPSRYDDDEPQPRKKVKPPESMKVKKVRAIAGGLLAVLGGGAWLAWMFMGDGRFRFYPLILLAIGLIGLFQGFTGVGLGDSDEQHTNLHE
ncbi:MAG: hypothetical protein EXS09_01295 [Gemmataceae bacterium]|nr:hypothetical protein [Gemmataceae bacterium]